VNGRTLRRLPSLISIDTLPLPVRIRVSSKIGSDREETESQLFPSSSDRSADPTPRAVPFDSVSLPEVGEPIRVTTTKATGRSRAPFMR
jgi:hypothetical protein